MRLYDHNELFIFVHVWQLLSLNAYYQVLSIILIFNHIYWNANILCMVVHVFSFVLSFYNLLEMTAKSVQAPTILKTKLDTTGQYDDVVLSVFGDPTVEIKRS